MLPTCQLDAHQQLTPPWLKTLITLLAACSLSAPGAWAEEADASDGSGLKQVDTFDVTAAFVRPGTDFSAYEQVMFLECPTAFVKGWQKRVNRRRKPNERVTDKDIEQITSDLTNRFDEVFTQEFTKRGGYALAPKEARGVLLVRPAVFDIDMAPPRSSKGLFLGTAQGEDSGAASLFIEVYDAQTSELLVRLIDRRQMRDMGVVQDGGRATNSLAMRKQLQRWARVVLEGLEELERSPVT
ncbi:MAG: DUF3313 family protein [Pseudomonadota bacterium]